MKRIIIGFSIFFISLIFFVTKVSAETVNFNPANQNIGQNANFSLPLYISNAQNAFGIGFDLTFDPNLFSYVNSNEGTFFNQGCSTILLTATSTADGGMQKVVFGLTRLGSSCGGLNGQGLVATLNFRSRSQSGNGNFDFINNSVCELNGTTCNYVAGSWLPANITVDTSAPIILAVNSNKTNGTYTVGEIIDIDITFSEAVSSTGNVTVTLETGVTDRTCTFIVANATTGTCNYTVQAGDTTSDLNVNTISGTIRDAALNQMTNFVPVTNLSANKNIVVDTTIPAITVGPASSNITPAGATITWATNENSTTQVNYGLTTAYGSTTTLDSTLATGHSQGLSGLTASTTYHYRVRSKDAVGNEMVSGDFTFTTLPTPDTSAPASVANLAVSTTTVNSITLTWTAPGDDNDSGIATIYDVRYSSSNITVSNWASAVPATGEPAPHLAGTAETMTVSGLNASTTYYFAIKTRDEVPNESGLSNVIDGTTLILQVDTTAPVISNISATSITTSGATINWTTDEPSDSQMEYGTTVSYGNQTTFTAATKSHAITLSGLSANTNYHYRVISKDTVGNIAISTDNTFTTQSSGGNGGGGSGGGGATPPTPPVSQIYDKLPTAYKLVATSTQVTLTWKNPIDSNFSKVVVIRSTELLTDYMNYATIKGLGEQIYEGTVESFADSNLAPNLNYYYAIFSIDKSGKPSNSQILLKSAFVKPADAGQGSSTSSGNSISYKDLAGASKEVVEKVSFDEAVEIYEFNKYVEFNDTTRRLYFFVIGKSPNLLDEQDKFAIAFYIHYGTPTTYVLGAGERTGVLNSYLTVFSKLPTNEKEWQDVVKIANGRWPDQRNFIAENKAQNTYYVQVYMRKPNMTNTYDNAAVTVITYGLRPRLRNMDSEKASIRIFKAIFKDTPVDAKDWDIVRAIAYSGSKR